MEIAIAIYLLAGAALTPLVIAKYLREGKDFEAGLRFALGAWEIVAGLYLLGAI